MQLISNVETYIQEAMRRAQLERFEDGTLVASVPGLEGVIAGGADIHECAQELYRRLEDYVRVGLARGLTMPRMGDIDLNTDLACTLATYHPSRLEMACTEKREYFEDPSEFKQALIRNR